MNIGLVTSYIIAGILLLSILMMNLSVSNSSIETTLRQTNQQKLSSISNMISHDIQKIGYNRKSRTSPILLEAAGKKIRFNSNIYNDADESVETVTWEFTNNEVTATENPNDFILRRTVEDSGGNIIEQTPIQLGVTEFNLSYYNEYGVPISDSLSTPVSSTDLSSIKQIYVKINLASAEKSFAIGGDDGRYVLSVWEKRFSPPNLEPN
jgi:hypothetical protein